MHQAETVERQRAISKVAHSIAKEAQRDAEQAQREATKAQHEAEKARGRAEEVEAKAEEAAATLGLAIEKLEAKVTALKDQKAELQKHAPLPSRKAVEQLGVSGLNYRRAEARKRVSLALQQSELCLSDIAKVLDEEGKLELIFDSTRVT